MNFTLYIHESIKTNHLQKCKTKNLKKHFISNKYQNVFSVNNQRY